MLSDMFLGGLGIPSSVSSTDTRNCVLEDPGFGNGLYLFPKPAELAGVAGVAVVDDVGEDGTAPVVQTAANRHRK